MKCRLLLLVLSVVVCEEYICNSMIAKFGIEDLNTIVDTNLKQIVGTWLSEGCETRFGPQYLLRSYTFREDGTYKLIQHYYWDSSCSSPKLTITSTGLLRMTHGAVHNPEAATGFVKPINITLIPQDSDAANELKGTSNKNCPDKQWQQWKIYEEYLLYDIAIDDFFTRSITKSELSNISCLGVLKWAFSELKLIKIQLRPILNTVFDDSSTKPHKVELLLGNIYPELMESHSPTSFHAPLIKWTQERKILAHGKHFRIKNLCAICESLHKSGKSPPHLLKKPELPPYIWGNWISTRCEIKPMGLYLTRRFFFQPNVWIGEHKYYLDPFCAVPKYSITTAGNFKLFTKNKFELSATDIDLNIWKATFTIFDRRMLEEMSKSKTCNKNPWELDIPYELSQNRDCSHFNLLIPSTEYQIIKVDINYEGSSLLYLGMAEAYNFFKLEQKRPTTYREPLMKCVDNSESQWNGELINRLYFSLSDSCKLNSNLYLILIILFNLT